MKLLVCFIVVCATALYLTRRLRVEIDSARWGAYTGKNIGRCQHRLIPPILYKTGPHDWVDISTDVRSLINNTIMANPHYTLQYYSNKTARQFLQSNFASDVVHAFDLLRPGAFKADILRYALLYKLGGVYSDLTQTILKPLDYLVPIGEELVLVQDKLTYDHKLRPVKSVQISFMAARAGLPLFNSCLNKAVYNVLQRKYNASPLDVTGPAMFGRILFRYLNSNTDCRPLITTYQGYKTIRDIDTHEVLIQTKLRDHDTAIEKTLWNHYGVLWATKRLYK